jgi:hypothetical protein
MVVHKAAKSEASNMHIKIKPPPILNVIISTTELVGSNAGGVS